ncbi:hypothetical protein SRHO_G00116080 [Serrasalmus rhombeus]
MHVTFDLKNHNKLNSCAVRDSRRSRFRPRGGVNLRRQMQGDAGRLQERARKGPRPGTAITQQWEEEPNLTSEEDDWDMIIRRIHSSSVCAEHGLIQSKLVHRTYWTKGKLAKLNPDLDVIDVPKLQLPCLRVWLLLLCSRFKD